MLAEVLVPVYTNFGYAKVDLAKYEKQLDSSDTDPLTAK